MADQVMKGAALAAAEAHVGGPCFENESFVTVGTSLISLVNQNPDRVALVFINNGASDVFIGLTSAISTTQGIRLTANGGSATLNVHDDMTLTARQWLAISSGAGNVVTVEELIRLTQTQQSLGA